MIFAQVKNNIIVNIIELEDESLAHLFKQDNDFVVRIDTLDPIPGIGWVFDNITWHRPVVAAAPIYHAPEISPMQMRQALILSGTPISQVDDAIATLPEPQLSLTKTEWEYSLSFQRDSLLVNTVGSLLGWSSEQLDELWLFAETL